MMRDSQPSSQSARRLVVVADDEPALQLIVARLLVTLNFVPLLAEGGTAAIAAVQTRQSEVCGAILDIAMPGVDGITAAYVIQRLVPDLPIVFMSGALPNDFAARTAGLRLAGTLRKPFPLAALRALVQQTFADGSVRAKPAQNINERADR